MKKRKSKFIELRILFSVETKRLLTSVYIELFMLTAKVKKQERG